MNYWSKLVEIKCKRCPIHLSFYKVKEIFKENQAVRSYHVIRRVMFENAKNTTFRV